MQTIRKVVQRLLLVSRPISWPNTAYPFGAGYLVAGGELGWTFWLGVLYFAIPYNLLMYGINDVFDYESDIKNPRKGGIEGMREQRAFHPTIVWAAVLSNLPFFVYFLLLGTAASRVVFAGTIFMVLAYSVAVLRFKERPFLDSFTSSCHFVGPLAFALTLLQWPVQTRWYVLAFFLWGMASHAFGAVQDILPDREARIGSIATVLGARPTVCFSTLLYAAASLLVLVQGGLAIPVSVAGLLYVANTARFHRVTDATSATTNRGWKRFLWLNYLTGFVVTVCLLATKLLR